MPRPRIRRRIWFQPDVTYFKPVGVPIRLLEEVILDKEGLEAIRLADAENMDQEKAAKKMNVSQPTFSRILDSAHKKIAEALVNGKSIKIEGGVYKMVRPRGGRFRAGPRGKGRMGGAAAGPGGFCICPKCKHKIKHTVGTPCMQISCPKCKTKMIRK